MSKIPFVKNRDSVTFYVDGAPKIISKAHINYYNILDALESGTDIESIKPMLVEVRQSIADSSDGLIAYEDGKLIFDGKPLHNALTTRIVSLMRDGFDVGPMVNFLRNLLDNPSKTAVDELYLFMESCNLPITADGHFIAYKMIRNDWTDKHSGTMDNSVGATVKMRRNEVDDKRHNTCSDGLHFASLHYVTNGNFGSRNRGDRLVALKINPRDVVSIPSDYNNSKGRACEYLVLRELDWDERLPVNNTGFRFLDEEEATAAGDDGAVLVLTPSGAVSTKAKPQVWTDDEIRKVKRMLAEPDATLSGISRETATVLSRRMDRRQIARIRDGEYGAHVTI